MDGERHPFAAFLIVVVTLGCALLGAGLAWIYIANPWGGDAPPNPAWGYLSLALTVTVLVGGIWCAWRVGTGSMSRWEGVVAGVCAVALGVAGLIAIWRHELRGLVWLLAPLLVIGGLALALGLVGAPRAVDEPPSPPAP